jgi:hypothetical protein
MKKLAVLLCLQLILSFHAHAQKTDSPSAKPKSSAAAAEAGSEQSPSAARLPIRRVVLYKNGVGYFEHLGQVRGSQSMHIDFTSAQLNDVLKSLTVLDLSGGRVTGVEYNSEAPLARRLATLRLALGERPTVAEFLNSLRGARLEVRSGAGPQLTGRLLSVERKSRTGLAPGLAIEIDEISLVTDSGEVRSVDLNSSTSVKIAEKDLQLEVGRYLSLIASSRDQDVRRMDISTTGTGERSLYVSYISEVPIWKTTYRIVLSSKAEKKPLLQGWAIIDNTVGEDWDGVELSLVAGAPHSFIQQLSEPFYGRRPVVPLPQSVQLSPQTHGAMLSEGAGRLTGTVTDASGAVIAGAQVNLRDKNNAIVAQTTSDSSGNYEFSGLHSGSYRAEIQSQGFQKTVITALNIAPGDNHENARLQVGATTQTVSVESASPMLETSSADIGGVGGSGAGIGPTINGHSPASLPMSGRNFASLTGNLDEIRSRAEAAASGSEIGDLFEYKLKDRVTLKKNQSGMVPIIQANVDAEKISLWSGSTGSGRPLSGLWLKNTTAATLESGSFSVLENEVFAGEGLTESIKPNERRLISYATNLGMLVNTSKEAGPSHISRVTVAHGVMVRNTEVREKTIYSARNQTETAQTLIIEHPDRGGWELVSGSQEPDEKAPGLYRFRLKIPPQATASLPIEEHHVTSTTFQLTSLADDNISYFALEGSITVDLRKSFEAIVAQKVVLASLQLEITNRQKDIDRIVKDQDRLRENMKALRGTPEEKALLQRYTKQLDDQETQLATLRKTVETTELQRDAANEKLQSMIQDLQFDTTF